MNQIRLTYLKDLYQNSIYMYLTQYFQQLIYLISKCDNNETYIKYWKGLLESVRGRFLFIKLMAWEGGVCEEVK